MEVYERETVNDFIALTEELLYYLGEGFVSGALRDGIWYFAWYFIYL